MFSDKDDIFQLLNKFGLADQKSTVELYHQTRDNPDVSVYRCSKSGVIFLKNSSHLQPDYYDSKKGFEYWDSESRENALKSTYKDDLRRFNFIKRFIEDKNWLDVGTGLGGILDLGKDKTSICCAIEPQSEMRKTLVKLGYQAFSSMEDLSTNSKDKFDIVTLFHVFEHLASPIELLKQIKNQMKTGGKIVIEVPHAKDFLIDFFHLESFMKFTFWSEHLILHTKESLTKFLENAGFQQMDVVGIQRYPLNNHLNWLANGTPGGHQLWDHLHSEKLHSEYEKLLEKNNYTDTLIAVAVCP